MLVNGLVIWYNRKKRFIRRLGVSLMRKVREKNKFWLDKHSVKILHILSERKRFRTRKGIIEHKINISKKTNDSPQINSYRHNKTNITFIAPKIFSIKENPEETIEFFNSILSKYNEHKLNTKFYIDSSQVEFVSVDALMYLLAIISNGKYQSVYRYGFSGNFPTNSEAKKAYVDSGFLKFVYSEEKGRKLNYQTDKISILQGKLVDPTTAAEVCRFVQDKCACQRTQIQPIYEILIELMSNTKQHAYEEKNAILKSPACWFLFAEEKEDSIDFVFLDTGLGIPTTVNQKLIERIFSKDSDLLKSALNGNFRSQTKQSFRGKGLPQISKCFSSGMFDNIFIYSERGCCKMNNKTADEYETIEFKNKVLGTLFCWKIIKTEVKL